MRVPLVVLLLTAASLLPADLRAQAGGQPESEAAIVPRIGYLANATSSSMRDVVERYASDRSALLRRYDAAYSAERRDRLRDFYRSWRERLRDADFESFGVEERVDYVLLRGELEYELHRLEREEELLASMEPLIPFAATILRLHEERRRAPSIDGRAAADTLASLVEAVHRVRRSLAAAIENEDGWLSRIDAFRAAEALEGLQRTMGRWYGFYGGYDPLFTWWAAQPYEEVQDALKSYADFLRKEVVGIREGEDPIVGDPIGAEAMTADLRHEMIPYTPEELIAIAEREFAWCEAEMLKAAREMGHGDDWQAALEEVKTLHVPPGEQPEMVRMLAQEAVDFLRAHDLVTIPPLAEEVWRIEMMSPERQKVNPFFTGGEVISVSFPTDEMAHGDKLMSMRGNNVHFARATVHHELIPGHHLQGFMTRRHNAHRQLFSTPFWGEGWALYWEMQLWDLDFPQTPEDRVGMLFWRMHRAARIIFSLGFHLGRMTPEEAIDFLVERVGHERANATAEVRRSFAGSYPPLYQAAYMLGGLQFRALHEQLVGTGRMTNRAFHDAILQGGRMPVELVRVRLMGELIPPDYSANWRFAGEPLAR